MGSHVSIRAAGLSPLLALLALAALAVAEPFGVPEEIVVRREHDAWVLAYPLGSVDGLLQVHATIGGKTRAHYYSLIARRGQWLHVELHTWPRDARHPPRLRLALVGPGLPTEGAAQGATKERGERGPPHTPPSHQPGLPDGDALHVRAPVRGRYVLVVRADGPGAGAYRLRFQGMGSWRLSALARWPLRRVEAAHLVRPRHTRAWALAAIGAGCALAGLHHLIRRRRLPGYGNHTGRAGNERE